MSAMSCGPLRAVSGGGGRYWISLLMSPNSRGSPRGGSDGGGIYCISLLVSPMSCCSSSEVFETSSFLKKGRKIIDGHSNWYFEN